MYIIKITYNRLKNIWSYKYWVWQIQNSWRYTCTDSHKHKATNTNNTTIYINMYYKKLPNKNIVLHIYYVIAIGLYTILVLVE